jgi:Flp pilus assembly protein TadD
VVVLISRQGDRFVAKDWAWWEAALYRECVTRGMQRVRVYNHEPEYYLWVMADARTAARFGSVAMPLADDLMKKGLDELYAKNDPSRAVTTFEQVLRENPEHYGAHYQLSVALDRAGRRDDATRRWEKTLALAKQYGDKETIQRIQARLGQGQ